MVNVAVQAFAVVGLGNPGKRYINTRHNLGFLVVEELAKELKISFKTDKNSSSLVAKGKVEDREIHLILPQTFMNESGWAVRRYLDYHRITASQLVVVCDDTALNLGQLRVRRKGSSGGHNGLKSIEAHLSTQEFIRLKMGVGNSGVEQPLAEYVLSNFNQAEAAVLEEFIKQGAFTLKLLLTQPLEQVMNQVNTKLII